MSIEVAPGSFSVLLGLGLRQDDGLRIVAGLETASEGRVEIAGRDVTKLPPAARGVAMVFQSYALFPHLNVAENIAFGLKARRVPQPERASRLARAVEILGIALCSSASRASSPAASSSAWHSVGPSSPRRRCA